MADYAITQSQLVEFGNKIQDLAPPLQDTSLTWEISNNVISSAQPADGQFSATKILKGDLKTWVVSAEKDTFSESYNQESYGGGGWVTIYWNTQDSIPWSTSQHDYVGGPQYELDGTMYVYTTGKLQEIEEVDITEIKPVVKISNTRFYQQVYVSWEDFSVYSGKDISITVHPYFNTDTYAQAGWWTYANDISKIPNSTLTGTPFYGTWYNIETKESYYINDSITTIYDKEYDCCPSSVNTPEGWYIYGTPTKVRGAIFRLSFVTDYNITSGLEHTSPVLFIKRDILDDADTFDIDYSYGGLIFQASDVPLQSLGTPIEVHVTGSLEYIPDGDWCDRYLKDIDENIMLYPVTGNGVQYGRGYSSEGEEELIRGYYIF